MKRITAFLIALLLGFCFSAKVSSLPLRKEDTQSAALTADSLSAKSAILIDADEGSVLFEKNADEPLGPASTTKLMTALVVLSICDTEETVTVTREAVGVEGSSIYLVEGERLTVRELIYALLLSSANDAATALAIHASGSIEAFVEEMNLYAKRMGLKSTSFVNPHGLFHEEHYTTARELALIGREALGCELIAEAVGMRKATIPHDGVPDKRLLVNHNRLLSSYDGAMGMKTGFTKRTGRTLVSAARRDGLTLIAVTLDAPDDWRDHTAMLDYGFSSYERVTFYAPEELEYSLPLCGGTKDSVTLTNTEPLSLTVKRGDTDYTLKIEGSSRFLIAPARKGSFFGTVTLKLGSLSVTSPLTVAESIDGTTKRKLGFFERIASFFTLEQQ